MSYNSQMFGRFVDEIERIVCECEDDGSTMGIEDVNMYDVLVSLTRLTSLFGRGYELARKSLMLAACEFGDMGDMVEKPEIVDCLLDQLLKYDGFEFASCESFCMWVKKWSE